VSIRNFKNSQPRIGNRVYIDETAVVIGDVIIGDDVSIWPTAVIRGDVESIRIGDGSNIQDGSILHVSHAGDFSPQGYPLIIGQNVTIGHRAVVHGCTIGNYCLVGIGAIIMDNVKIDDFVMIGAGSLVPPGKKLESGFLYLGSPSKLVRALSDAEKDFLKYSSSHYQLLKDEYLLDIN
jgi:carbonic anhydrase/acetyltransferase-like protein (isoleucine patch superfamily)